MICSQSLIFIPFHDTTLLLVCFRKKVRKPVAAYKMIFKNVFSDLANNSLVDLWRQRTIKSLETSLKMSGHRSVLNAHFVFFYMCFLHACISKTLTDSRQKRYTEVFNQCCNIVHKSYLKCKIWNFYENVLKRCKRWSVWSIYWFYFEMI